MTFEEQRDDSRRRRIQILQILQKSTTGKTMRQLSDELNIPMPAIASDIRALSRFFLIKKEKIQQEGRYVNVYKV